MSFIHPEKFVTNNYLCFIVITNGMERAKQFYGTVSAKELVDEVTRSII